MATPAIERFQLIYLFFSSHLRQALWNAAVMIWLLAAGLYFFIQQIALVENTVAATAVSAWMAHLLLVILLIIWWASTLAEEHQTRFEQVLHALPFSRTTLLLARFISWWTGGLLLAGISLLPLILLGVAPLYAFQWAVSFALELTIVLALVLFYGNLSNHTPVIALTSMLTYLFLRLLPYMEILSNRKLLEQQLLQNSTQGFFQTISHFFPNLKPFAASDMLIHGASWQALGQQALIAVIFSLFLLAVAGFDLNKRELKS